MDIPRWSVAAGLLVVFAGCEHGAPVEVQLAPERPQSESLSPAVRGQLAGTLDLGAMDRLLATLAPAERTHFLRSFEDVEWAVGGRRDVETRDVTFVVRYGDAGRQQLLEQSWAPFWSRLPPAVLSDPSYPLPGRRLATTRRGTVTPDPGRNGKEREP